MKFKLFFFVLNRGKIELLAHTKNDHIWSFHSRDIPKRLKNASTSPGLPYFSTLEHTFKPLGVLGCVWARLYPRYENEARKAAAIIIFWTYDQETSFM